MPDYLLIFCLTFQFLGDKSLNFPGIYSTLFTLRTSKNIIQSVKTKWFSISICKILKKFSLNFHITEHHNYTRCWVSGSGLGGLGRWLVQLNSARQKHIENYDTVSYYCLYIFLHFKVELFCRAAQILGIFAHLSETS